MNETSEVQKPISSEHSSLQPCAISSQVPKKPNTLKNPSKSSCGNAMGPDIHVEEQPRKICFDRNGNVNVITSPSSDKLDFSSDSDEGVAYLSEQDLSKKKQHDFFFEERK